MHHRFPARLLSTTKSAVIAAAAMLIGACAGDDGGPAMGGGMGPPGGERPPVAVTVATVTGQRFVDKFTALGTARASESIEVTSRISSIIDKIHFEEGQKVKTGDLLITLDNREISAQLAMAEATLKQKRSQYERSKALSQSQAVSQAELEQLEADVFVADADVRGARSRLNNSYIRAPFSGVVGLRRVSVGDLVGPETIITTLDALETIKLEFAIPETFLSSLDTGMTIEANSDVYPGEPFAGTVSNIDSRVDPTTRSVTVIARIDNQDRLLRPGMFLTVSLEKARDDVLMVPEEALVPRQGRQFVYVVEDGYAIEKQVELGQRAPGLAEVRTGLSAGDMVVTEGTQKVRDGAPVRVVGNS